MDLALILREENAQQLYCGISATIVRQWPPGRSEGHGLCRHRPAITWCTEAVAVVTGPPLIYTDPIRLENSTILVKVISSSVI